MNNEFIVNELVAFADCVLIHIKIKCYFQLTLLFDIFVASST